MNVAEQESEQVGETSERIQHGESTTVPVTEKTINIESDDDEDCGKDHASEDNEGREEKRNAGSFFIL